MLTYRQKAMGAATVVSLGLSACGGTSHHATRPAATHESTEKTSTNAASMTAIPLPNASPDQVLARVGDKTITLARIRHLMAVSGAPEAVPDPPNYPKCIAALRAAPPTAGKPAGAQGEAELKLTCQHSYEQLLRTALGRAIHEEWVLGEAAEQGLTVNTKEVNRELDAGEKSFGTKAKFEAYRRSTQRTKSDLTKELAQSNLALQLFEKLKAKEHKVGSADAARFYASHSAQFAIPPGRSVRIVRTASERSALKVKKEVEQGTSFANEAAKLSAIGQPLGAKNGEVRDLKPHVFEEKALNDAIFNAKLHRVYGPVYLTTTHKTIAPETNTGYFIFEVTGTVPGGRTPLSRVEEGIKQALAKAEHERIVPSFVIAYRRRWKAKTDCQPGYVVTNCNQFHASKAEETYDPYTL